MSCFFQQIQEQIRGGDQIDKEESVSRPALLEYRQFSLFSQRRSRVPELPRILYYSPRQQKKERQGGYQANPAARKGNHHGIQLCRSGINVSGFGKGGNKGNKETHQRRRKGIVGHFGFDREDEWKAVMLSSQVILITDESQDLNMADVCLDIDTFLLWLEGSHEERQKADEKERQFLEQQEQIGIKAEH